MACSAVSVCGQYIDFKGISEQEQPLFDCRWNQPVNGNGSVVVRPDSQGPVFYSLEFR